MTHLSTREFVDLVESTLDRARAAHVETCAACREQADALRAMLARGGGGRRAGAVAAFLGAPVGARAGRRGGGAGAGRGPAGWVGVRGLVPLAAAAALIVAVVSGVIAGRAAARRSRAGAGGRRSTAAGRRAEPVDGAPDAENAEVWAVAAPRRRPTWRSKTRTTRACTCHPAAIDHAVQDLSAAERTELGAAPPERIETRLELSVGGCL